MFAVNRILKQISSQTARGLLTEFSTVDRRCIVKVVSPFSDRKGFISTKTKPADQTSPVLLYTGNLKNRIKLLKTFSLLSSTAIIGTYSYIIALRGCTTTLAATGVIFTPFIASPVLIWWIFKRYVTKLSYDPSTMQYTLNHCGIFLREKQLIFKRDDVIQCPGSEVLNTFRVKGQPFFLNEEDLIDANSVEQYKIMIGLDK